MQKKSLKAKGLTLHKETLRSLQEGQLVEAHGAYPHSANSACTACSNIGTWCACGTA